MSDERLMRGIDTALYGIAELQHCDPYGQHMGLDLNRTRYRLLQWRNEVWGRLHGTTPSRENGPRIDEDQP